ncbi:hypothetical protein [Microcoleus sp. AT9b-C3]|uniref:hypothetical protein n=1 Tax=Microcoleus sp. AT9b-C3 TaxID=2818629 RepID=UPI002FD62957
MKQRKLGNQGLVVSVLVEQIEQMAAELGITAGQLALAWVLAQGEDIVPMKRH